MKSKSININDNPQPSDDFQKKGLSNCQENMFDSLINKLTPTRFEAGKDGDINSSQSLISLKTEDYPEIPTSKYISEKIRELKYLTQSIEKKSGGKHPDTKIDFSNYSVDYLSELNSAQLVSVTTTEGPLLVIAGAGTGKTRVIVFRVSFLIESGVDPQSILLLTFTRKSAKEMIDRVETLLNNENVGMITGGTFHSFANHILRKYSRLIGLPPDFTIIDTADSEDIIDLLRSELKFVTKDRRFPRKSRVYDIISYSRNKQLTIEQIINQDYTGLIDFIKDIESLLIAYTKYKRASHLLDFDDLLEVLCDALKENNQFKEIMQDKYKYIMVDEFQDTNVIQNEIVNILAGNHRRIMVVGDDAQSIYSFRGANYENILRFPEMYADCSVIKIEENFRSNDKILNFTNSIIDNAQIRYKKNLFTKHISNHLPIVKAIYGQEEEAKFIVDSISELLERGISLNQIAVLNRADWHNRYIQMELNKRKIPYVVVGGFKFHERMHIKDVIAYLRITSNPLDAVSWHRIMKYVDGVGKITASEIITAIHSATGKFSFAPFRKRKFFNELQRLGDLLTRASIPENTISQRIEIIYDYYIPILKTREAETFGRIQDLEILIDLSKKYKNLETFLSDFALDPPTKRMANQTTPLIDETEDDGKLTISTIHSAKGLEWYAVFVPHALEGLLPSIKAVNVEEMEEELRLFYVACSRAKEELYITYPRNVFSANAFFHLPSRFLIEIDRDKFLYNPDGLH